MHTSLTLIVLFLSISSQLTATQAQEQNHTWQEAFKALGISWNSDGTSLNRQVLIPMVDPTPYEDSKPTPTKALSTDIPLSPNTKAYVRLYIPLHPPKDQKLPLIIYFHGGDFILYSASTVIFHNFCNEVASQFPAVVASVEYRLAPENKLPAAYDDALNAIFWARDQALELGGRDPWMEYANFSNVFLLGSSAGANIAFQVALRALDFDMRPLQIRGLLMNQAFFGGEKRMQEEINMRDDPYIPLYVNDVLWTLALNENENRDSPFSNPYQTSQIYWDRLNQLPKMYVKMDTKDPLWKRSFQLSALLCGQKVTVYYRRNNGHHGIELRNATAAQELYEDMKYFVNNLSMGGNVTTGLYCYNMRNIVKASSHDLISSI